MGKEAIMKLANTLTKLANKHNKDNDEVGRITLNADGRMLTISHILRSLDCTELTSRSNSDQFNEITIRVINQVRERLEHRNREKDPKSSFEEIVLASLINTIWKIFPKEVSDNILIGILSKLPHERNLLILPPKGQLVTHNYILNKHLAQLQDLNLNTQITEAKPLMKMHAGKFKKILLSILKEHNQEKDDDVKLTLNNSRDGISLDHILYLLQAMTFSNPKSNEVAGIVMRVLDQVTRRLEKLEGQKPKCSFEEIVLASALNAMKLSEDLAVWNVSFYEYLPHRRGILQFADPENKENYVYKRLIHVEKNHLDQIGFSDVNISNDLPLPGQDNKLFNRLKKALKHMDYEDLKSLEKAAPSPFVAKAAHALASEYIEKRMNDTPKKKTTRTSRSKSMSGSFFAKEIDKNTTKNKPKRRRAVSYTLTNKKR